MGKEQIAQAAPKAQVKEAVEEKPQPMVDVKQDMVNLMGTILRSERLITKKNGGLWTKIVQTIDSVSENLDGKDIGQNNLWYEVHLSNLQLYCKEYVETHSRTRFSIEGRRRKRYATQLNQYIKQYFDNWQSRQFTGSGETIAEKIGIDTSRLHAGKGEAQDVWTGVISKAKKPKKEKPEKEKPVKKLTLKQMLKNAKTQQERDGIISWWETEEYLENEYEDD